MLLSTLRKSSFVAIHTQTVISQAATALDQIIGFTKKCFNIRSTTDEHSFLFVLSLSRLFKMYYYALLKGFCLSNSLNAEILVISYVQSLSNVLSSEPLSPDILTLNGGQSAML